TDVPAITEAGGTFTDLKSDDVVVGAYRDPAAPEERPSEEPKPKKKPGEKKKKQAKKPVSPKAATKRRPGRAGEPAIPELARKIAFVCFAASGAAALCYEVVWSRALAMTIGSSIYSFALILETFLIGIAAGSAAMSAFMGDRARPLIGLAVPSGALIFLPTVPWAIDIID